MGDAPATRKPGNWIVVREVSVVYADETKNEETGGEAFIAWIPVRGTPFVASSKKAAIKAAAIYLALSTGDTENLLAINEADYTPSKITVKVPDPVVAFS